MKNLVILPTYNESKNIVQTINLVLAQRDDLNILIVDDNSPDGTAKIVKDLNNEKIFII
jgi:dolichol-phosphate mannosyltransferase